MLQPITIQYRDREMTLDEYVRARMADTGRHTREDGDEFVLEFSDEWAAQRETWSR